MAFTPVSKKLPLLPYEKQLIQTLGCTEEEYRFFVREAQKRAQVRPAAYSSIPDIRATGLEPWAVAALVSLAIGAVTTVASILLAPKPRDPGARRGTSRDLGSVEGRDRFNSTFGFDTAADLAKFGEVIPIVFGLYSEEHKIGGILVSPKLVWSRMFSYGTQQAAQMMFVVGEQGKSASGDAANTVRTEGIKPPALEGIFLGNNALDAVFDSNFDFYWKRNTTLSETFRIRHENKRYGTAEVLEPGAPRSARDEVFVGPTSTENDGNSAVSSAFSPANNIEFGVYSPIANGTFYRVDWRVVSIPGGDDPKKRLDAERKKIAGFVQDGDVVTKDFGRSYMVGQGRNYSCRMGLVDLRGSYQTVDLSDGGYKTLHKVNVGNEATFHISHLSIPEDAYQRKASVDDINSAVSNLQLQADEAFQIGELFAIGSTIWKVVKRSQERFEPGEVSQDITLRCVDISESESACIGTVSKNPVVTPNDFFVKDDLPNVGISWYPLTRYAKGIVRNNRPCHMTEIGISSQVFQQLSGLANFPSMPSPRELFEADEDKVSINSGTISGYITRASFFTVYIRPAGVDEDGNEFSFEPTKLLFAITGTNPTRQYNQIRFVHPNSTYNSPGDEYEYKFVPRPAADIRKRVIDGADLQAIHLDASLPVYTKTFSVGPYGFFGLHCHAQDRLLLELQSNKEFIGSRKVTTVVTNAPTLEELDIDVENKLSRKVQFLIPGGVRLDDIYPEAPLSNKNIVSSIRIEGVAYASQNSGWGRQGAFFAGVFGHPDKSGIGINQTATKDVLERIGDRWIVIRYRAQRIQHQGGHFTSYNNGASSGWSNISVEVLGSSNGWSDGERIQVQRGANSTAVGSHGNFAFTASNNPYYRNRQDAYYDNGGGYSDLTYAGFTIRVSTRSNYDRGDNQAYYYNQFGSPEAYDSGYKASRQVTLSNPSNSSQQYVVRLNVYVKTVSQSEWYFNPPNTKIWQPESVELITDNGNAITQEMQLEHSVSVSSGNLLGIDYYREGKKIKARYKFGANTVHVMNVDYEVKDSEQKRKNYDRIVTSNTIDPSSTYWDDAKAFALAATPVDPFFDVPELDIEDKTTVIESTRIFEGQSQWAEMSFYRGSVTKSCANNPEHTITYVNELFYPVKAPDYPSLTTAGLSLRASRGFNRLDQMRCWLSAGITCRRLHEDLSTYNDPEGSDLEGPSNLFTDLVYFLLTNLTAGAASSTNMTADNAALIDLDSFKETSWFLREHKLFCNGVITEKVNIQEFIAQNAPTFLCNFVIKNGKFGLTPAVPTTAAGGISTEPVTIKQIFTDGNILEDTFHLDYLSAEERTPFKANLRYRLERKNKLPEERVVSVDYKEYGEQFRNVETFDLTQFCTSRKHAEIVGRFFLLVRDLITHTIKFSTTAAGLDLAPGEFIKVETEVSPYNSGLNGTIGSDGTIVSLSPIEDGVHTVLYYAAEGESVETAEMQVSNGKATDPALFNSFFTITCPINSQNIYMVEQITFNEEMTVDIVASEYPCDDQQRSELALRLGRPELFTVSVNE